jgi:hypothetical protein
MADLWKVWIDYEPTELTMTVGVFEIWSTELELDATPDD